MISLHIVGQLAALIEFHSISLRKHANWCQSCRCSALKKTWLFDAGGGLCVCWCVKWWVLTLIYCISCSNRWWTCAVCWSVSSLQKHGNISGMSISRGNQTLNLWLQECPAQTHSPQECWELNGQLIKLVWNLCYSWMVNSVNSPFVGQNKLFECFGEISPKFHILSTK